MNENVGSILWMISLGVFFIFLFLVVGHIYSKEINVNWEKFARNMGLEFYKKGSTVVYPKVEGVFRGHDIVVEVIGVEGGGYIDSYMGSFPTKFSLKISNPKDVSMSICRKYTKKILEKDIQIGNVEFDRMFRVRGNNEQEIQRILNFRIQTIFLSLYQQKIFGSIEVKGKTAYFEVPDIINDATKLEKILCLLIDITDRLEGSCEIEIKEDKKSFSSCDCPPEQFSKIIPIWKFILLSFTTYGLYELFWFYKNWKFLKEKDKLSISPFWRTVFAPIFATSITEHIFEMIKDHEYKPQFPPTIIGTSYLVLVACSFISVFLEYSAPYWLISYFTFLPMIPIVQAMNIYWQKEHPDLPLKHFKWWQIMLITFGAMWLILMVLGAFIPE